MNSKEETKLIRLPATALRSNGAEYVRTMHHVSVSPDTTVEDVLRPAYWVHHVRTLQVGDLVDILRSDGGFDIQVRVINKAVGFVNVRPLRVWQRDDVDSKPEVKAQEEVLPDLPDGYIVNFAPKQKWRVMTKEPNEIISKNHESKFAAHNSAIAHFKASMGETV